MSRIQNPLQESLSETRVPDLWIQEAEEIVDAIRHGEVDALVVRSGEQDRVYTLKGSDAGYRVLFETLNEGALTLAADATILYANGRFAALVGVPIEKVLCASFRQFVSSTDEADFLALLEAGMSGSCKGEIRLTRADGTLVTAAVSLNAVGMEGAISACTAVVTDLTELRQAQTALEEANAALEARVEARTAELSLANAALHEADRQKDEFLSTLAHELRNPLAPILNSIQALSILGSKQPAVQRHRNVIERQVKNLARLVDDLMDVSRITRGKIVLRKETVNLRDLFDHAVEAVRPTVDVMAHELSVSLPEEPIWLEADGTRLEQVLVNLLMNAAKYTEPGGRISLSAECENDDIVVRIKDSGVGISADLLPHIFDLFVQEKRSLAQSQGGLGIGLTLVKNLVALHGGDIRVTSGGLGQGSEFVLRLPGRQPRPEETADPAVQAVAPGAAARVLIVEDNVDSAETLAEVLGLWGHEVRVVHTGKAALEVAAVFHPQAVLCDLGLPDLDGYTVARRLQELPNGADALLVALAGYGQEEDRHRTHEVGFAVHLTKPVDFQTLNQLLKSAAAARGPGV